MACIIAEELKLEIIIKNCDLSDDKNPYNSVVFASVSNRGFSGYANMTVDVKNIKEFINDITNMYKNLSGKAELKDLDYGSNILVECNYLGCFNFSGVLINDSFQKLYFKFSIDQTYIESFLNELLNDFKKILSNK